MECLSYTYAVKMKKRTITKTTQRTDEITIIRQAPSMIVRWCEGCAQTVQMAMPEDVAAMLGIQPRLIYRWVEEERVHFVESDQGALFVCCESVIQQGVG